MKCRLLTLILLLALPAWAQKTTSPTAQKPELVLQSGHRSPIASVRYSPDGKWAASVAHEDVFGDFSGSLKLWEVRTGALFRTFTGLPYGVNDVDFLDSKRLLCREEDGFFRIRSSRDGKILGAWAAKGPQQSNSSLAVRVLPNGRALSRSLDESITIWDLTSHRALAILAIPALADRVSPHWLTFTPNFDYQGSPNIEQFFKWRVGDKLLPGTAFKTKNQPQKIQQALR